MLLGNVCSSPESEHRQPDQLRPQAPGATFKFDGEGYPRFSQTERLPRTPRSADRASLRLSSLENGNIRGVCQRLSQISLTDCQVLEYRDRSKIRKSAHLAGIFRIFSYAILD
jgi:hypothetical protein